MGQLIRALEALCAEAVDFWVMTDRKPSDRAKAAAFFTDCLPGCDPALTQWLGFFQQDRLVGVAELAFGFPNPEDACFEMRLLFPSARMCGFGRESFAHLESQRWRTNGASGGSILPRGIRS